MENTLPGRVYLLHFEKPICKQSTRNPYPGGHTTQHYLGWAENLECRIKLHRQGKGSNLCQVAKARGINFTLARTWDGDRSLERLLKNQKNGPRLCPLCSPPALKPE